MKATEFQYGQRVVCRGTHGDMLATIDELHSDCELVRTQSGELRMFHKSKIIDRSEYEKGKRGKS